MLTAAQVQADLRCIRTVLPDAVVSVYHPKTQATVQGVRSTVSGEQSASSMGTNDISRGAVRVVVSELTEPHPMAGDLVRITEGTVATDYRVLAARYDQLKATLRIEYGERNAP